MPILYVIGGLIIGWYLGSKRHPQPYGPPGPVRSFGGRPWGRRAFHRVGDAALDVPRRFYHDVSHPAYLGFLDQLAQAGASCTPRSESAADCSGWGASFAALYDAEPDNMVRLVAQSAPQGYAALWAKVDPVAAQIPRMHGY